MKTTGEELVQRGHLDKYVPFGGLSAKELKDIENSCLLNRPRSEKEAILRNVSNIKGKNFDEVVENGYQKATETLTTLNGENYQKGQNPNKDKEYLETSANLIKGMKALRESEKIWNTYLPDFSTPKWKEPIHKHPIANLFRAVKRGFGITYDSLVKFPLTNIGRAIKYPLDKVANIISVNYNQRKLENIVYSKGFSKEDLQNAMNHSEKPTLNVEDDVKAIDANFKENAAKIEQYKKEQNKENVQKEEKKEVGFQNLQEQNPYRTEIVIHELDDNLLNEEKAPEIKENQMVKENNLFIND